MGRRRRRQVIQGAGARVGSLPEAIAALSRTLPAGPSPEIFRRAKFDLPEAAPALWRLLFQALFPLLEDRVSTLPSTVAQVGLVKSVLRAQGYPRNSLTQLPEDGSQSSRELLLALSWLLARGPLLEGLLARSRVRLGDEMLVCACEDLARGRASHCPPEPCEDAAGPVDVRLVQWLMGRLQIRWRKLFSSHQEHCALLSKIHEYTQGCHSDRALNHLSIVETELLRNPDGGQQLLWTLQRENAHLEAALEWRRLEPIFWQWMDTVLGASPPDTASQPMFLPCISEQGIQELELMALDLQTLLEELQDTVAARRASWNIQVESRGPQWKAALLASEEAIRQELADLQQVWEHQGCLAPPHGPHRLVRSEARVLSSKGLWATEAIGALRRKEAHLEAALHRLQTQCRQELIRLVGTLPGVIWIPPSGH
ncbi:tubulin epsilon and delta complex protein 1 [Rhynchocyon petersi]